MPTHKDVMLVEFKADLPAPQAEPKRLTSNSGSKGFAW
jgi:hypothetical protein